MASVSPSEGLEGDGGTPASVARLVLDLALSRPPTLGEGRLVSVDGPAGSGKTTLAEALRSTAEAAQLRTRVVHMDDLYDGWDGLPRVGDQLEGLLAPLGQHRAGSYRRFDWHAGEYAEQVAVEPVPLLVLEGVGSGAAAHDVLRTVLVWVEAPPVLRMRRGLERDGEAAAPHWERWTRDEAALFERERTRSRADVLVDGTGDDRPVVVGARRTS